MSTIPKILEKNGFTPKLRAFDGFLDSFDRVFSDFNIDVYII